MSLKCCCIGSLSSRLLYIEAFQPASRPNERYRVLVGLREIYLSFEKPQSKVSIRTLFSVQLFWPGRPSSIFRSFIFTVIYCVFHPTHQSVCAFARPSATLTDLSLPIKQLSSPIPTHFYELHFDSHVCQDHPSLAHLFHFGR